MGELELAGIAARLYALPFDDFVTARTAAAKEVVAGAPAKGPAAQEHRSLAAGVRSLPKPSVAAWTVNMLVLYQPEILSELAALGQNMRSAQSALDAAELRRLAQLRRQLLASAVKDAHAVAEQHGRKISGAIATEVEETLRAATADEGAAAAAQSGRLLRGLSADGVDVVELAGAVALPSATPPATAPSAFAGTYRSSPKEAQKAPKQPAREAKQPAPARKRPAPANEQQAQPRLHAVREAPRPATPSALERARAAFEEAEGSARAAAEDALRYGQELDETTALASRLADEARSLRKQLEQTEQDLKSARKRQELLAAQAQQAVRAADRAGRKEDLARERVLRLGNTPD
jgi:hypothetical protein